MSNLIRSIALNRDAESFTEDADAAASATHGYAVLVECDPNLLASLGVTDEGDITISAQLVAVDGSTVTGADAAELVALDDQLRNWGGQVVYPQTTPEGTYMIKAFVSEDIDKDDTGQRQDIDKDDISPVFVHVVQGTDPG